MSYGHDPRSAQHPRPDRRTFMVRRFVVLGLLIALVYAAVSVASGWFSNDSKAIGPASPVTNTVINDGRPPTTPFDIPATEPPVKARTIPTKDNPAVVLILGDSDAGGFGPYVQQAMQRTGVVRSKISYVTSSGLARPDYFDWPSNMRAVVPDVNPDIVIATFGGNDAQALRNPDKSWAVNHTPGTGGDDTDWRAEYGRRVGAAMDYLSKGNRTLIWVGIPNDDNPQNTARLKVQDEVVRAEAAKRSGKVVFIDTWSLFAGPDGSWSPNAPDPRDGQSKAVRRSDGFHLNDMGSQILSIPVFAAVVRELESRGATALTVPTTVAPTTLPSATPPTA
jgi:hypothetical protein